MYLQATCICECLEMRLQWAKEQVKYTYRAALSTKWCFLQFYELSSLLSHKQESFQILEKGIKIMRFRQCYWIDLALYIWIYYKVFEFWADQIVWSALAHPSSVILLIVYRHWIITVSANTSISSRSLLLVYPITHTHSGERLIYTDTQYSVHRLAIDLQSRGSLSVLLKPFQRYSD